MKINNSLDVANWEKLECKCNMGKETECYPFVKCEHCRCQQCWDSVPQENFTVNTFDKKGNKTGTKTIEEITLHRGSIEDVLGWSW